VDNANKTKGQNQRDQVQGFSVLTERKEQLGNSLSLHPVLRVFSLDSGKSFLHTHIYMSDTIICIYLHRSMQTVPDSWWFEIFWWWCECDINLIEIYFKFWILVCYQASNMWHEPLSMLGSRRELPHLIKPTDHWLCHYTWSVVCCLLS
jgi:hypothetical protein